jgi:hypothetical protein
VDRLDTPRKPGGECVAGLKSFDRGHTSKDAELGAEMLDLLTGE